MNTIRLYLTAAVVLLCAAIATVQAAAGQLAGASAAKDVPAAPEDGGPRNWQVSGVSSALNLREQPTTAAKIITTYPSGTISAANVLMAEFGAMSSNWAAAPAVMWLLNTLRRLCRPTVPWQRGRITRPIARVRAISTQRDTYPVLSIPANPLRNTNLVSPVPAAVTPRW